MDKAETKDRLKIALDIRNMKQSELVEKTGIDKGQLSSYLSGKYKPRQQNLHLLATALSVDEAWLMGYNVPMDIEESKIIQKQLENRKKFAEQWNKHWKEEKLLDAYQRLNDDGKQKVIDYTIDLSENPKYLKDTKEILMAAHNDSALEDGELEKMKSDIDMLDSLPEK